MRLFIALFTLLAFTIFGEPQPVAPKKYQLSVASIFKNEAKFLKEWILFHRLVGVDHFYLYDNGSNDRSKGILRPYIEEGIVTYVHWPIASQNDPEEGYLWALGAQITAYENARLTAASQSEWLTFLDADEFLVPGDFESIPDILSAYKDHPAVVLNHTFYNGSKVPSQELTIESRRMIAPPGENPFRSVEKTIFKPAACTHVTWYPLKYHFKGSSKSVVTQQTGLCINKYKYRTSSYLSDRHDRVSALYNRKHFDTPSLSLRDVGPEIEDRELKIHRFIPHLKQKLGMQ